ncbi:hypothetical protein F5Y15DRAFT_242320 [Xylariaceae sp. FL0016]|nr:hypothetical protein F5Y15DRAFT_242320 [Xylariaceae sp. FL0016]
MGRKPAPQPLSLPEHEHGSASPSSTATLTSPESIVPGARDRSSPRPPYVDHPALHITSPTSSKSPSSPRSPFNKFAPSRKPRGDYRAVEINQPYHHPSPHPADDLDTVQRQQRYPSQNSAGTPVTSPVQHSATTPTYSEASHGHRDQEKHSRNTSRFFNFGKSSKSSNQLHHQNQSNNGGMSRGAEYPGAMSERVSSKASKHSDQSSIEQAKPTPSKSDISLSSTVDYDNKKNKPKGFPLLSRSRSIKDKDGHSPKENLTIKMGEQEQSDPLNSTQPLKTAPIHGESHDRAFRHMMNSSPRNHSADRTHRRDTSAHKDSRNDKNDRGHPARDAGGSTFFGGLKSSGSRAADMISKGLFGKSGRSASTTEREPMIDDEHYVLKVINLPLVEQTRMTRISKRLEDSRDKTEFWMPAFPWRAIDYLNFNGTDVEGLYRVPGSGPQIKKWQRRFDEEHDVDLFAQDDLYDINIIGSMLKAWLRELPDELFPKEAQERISRECAGAEEVPQLLIDELSNLSPFNYYLLFAITCHLSLLLAHSDKNKMDFRNLCICFQPCMKIDAFCFKFLVCDWRLCWQGCKNEAQYIEDEYKLFNQPLPRGLTPTSETREPRNNDTGHNEAELRDDRITPSDGGKQTGSAAESQNGKLRKKPHGQSNGHHLAVAEQDTPRRSGDLRPLSPIKPLSPLGF